MFAFIKKLCYDLEKRNQTFQKNQGTIMRENMKVTPNFSFAGQCQEAIDLYQRAFQANVLYLLRYSDADPRDWDRELTEEQKNYVYHCELMIGDQRIMLADDLDIKFQTSFALSLVITFDTKEEVLNAYEIMKEGSETIYPVHSTTYSSCEVVFVDKFGIRWNLMTEQTER